MTTDEAWNLIKKANAERDLDDFKMVSTQNTMSRPHVADDDRELVPT